MSLFRMEDQGSEGLDPNAIDETVAGGLDESNTSTAEITELQQEDQSAQEADAEADDLASRLDLAEEQTEIVQRVVTEGVGLSPSEMLTVVAAMRRMAGRQHRHLVGKNVRMESMSGASGRLDQTKLVLEDLTSTLKSAWVAIKQAFEKAVNRVRGYIVRTFDTAKKLANRAEKIRDRADGMTGTIDKKTFSFAGASIAIDGKVKASEVLAAFARVEDISKTSFSVTKTDDVSKAADTLAAVLDGNASYDKLNSEAQTILTAVKAATNGTVTTGESNVLEASVKSGFGSPSEVTVNSTNLLPGSKVVVKVVGTHNGKEAADVIGAIRRSRLVMSNAKSKPRAYNGDAETLSVSQVTKLCDHVIEFANNISDWKRGWENRDKSHKEVVKTLDDFFKSVKDSADDATNPQERLARSVASASTQYLRRDSAFRGALATYALNVGSVGLSYCEASLRNYK